MPRPPTPRAILAVVAFGVFVAADDLTVVSTMLRQIIFDLEIPLPDGLDQAAWIVNAYLIAYVVVMPFVGRLSDLWGRRRVFMAAYLLFLIGSIWIPLADSFGAFLAGRVLTALGGGAMVPVALAVVGDVYPAQRRATALGTLGAIDTAGWVWGPLYGALLIRFLSWEWQFYLNIPLSLIGMGLTWWALADLPIPSERPRIDWGGTAVLTIALLSLNLALLGGGDIQAAGSFTDITNTQSGLAAYGWPLMGVTAVSLLIFILIERRLLDHPQRPPLINLRLFQRPNFTTAVLINFFVGCALIIPMVNVPLVINVLEIGVSEAAITSGLLLSGLTGAMALFSYAGGRLTERVGYRWVTAVGLLFCTIGLGLMGSGWQVDTPYSLMAIQLALLGSGLGLVIAPIGTAVINAAPVADRGVAASLVIVLRLMGMSVGLAALTAYGLRRFDWLRTRIPLPDLPLTDPAYQQAIVDGLIQVTVRVLTETFLVTAVVTGIALLIALRLRHQDA